jgi:error-prone DNA polymerase
MQILRPVFRRERILSCAETSALRDGSRARTAGIVLVRQRPGTGKAIFITLEDETGITNALIWARTFEKFRAEVMGARLLLIEGRVQKSPEGVTHLMGARVIDRTAELQRLSDDHVAETEPARADEIKHPQRNRTDGPPAGMHRHPRNVRILPKSRDFH